MAWAGWKVWGLRGLTDMSPLLPRHAPPHHCTLLVGVQGKHLI